MLVILAIREGKPKKKKKKKPLFSVLPLPLSLSLFVSRPFLALQLAQYQKLKNENTGRQNVFTIETRLLPNGLLGNNAWLVRLYKKF